MQKSYHPLHSFIQDKLSRQNKALNAKIAHKETTQ